MDIIPVLQQKVNKIVSAEGLGHGVLLEPSFLKAFRSGSKYVFGLRFGAVGLDACLKFLDTVKVYGMSLSFVSDDNSVWVSLSEASESPYGVYCSVANWANSHGVDVLSGDSRSLELQRKTDEKGNVSTSFIPVVDLLRSELVRGLVDDVLLYVGLLGVRGLARNEDGIKSLVGVVVWKVWLGWSRRYLFRRRVSDILRGASSKKREDGVKLQDAKLIKQADVLSKQADNWDRCGEHTYDMACLQCGHVHAVTFHCKSRVCPSCKSSRQLEVIEAYRDALMGLGRLRFITLTIKNVADLGAGIRKVRSCFKKLRLYDKEKDMKKAKPLGLSLSYKSMIKGGLYGIESPVGNDGLWNVHLHCLYAGSYIEQAQLADDWEKITGDSRVVWIEEVGRSQRDVVDSVRYVVKYACKQNDVLLASDDKLGEYMCVLHNTRLVQTFGLLLGKKADKHLFLCPECGGCVWKIVELDTVVGLNSERRYCRHGDHDEYLATMYKQ